MELPTTVFRNVRVFDGEDVVPIATVVVEDGVIAAIGSDPGLPPGASVVEGEGKTLLPGLIDAHTHVFGPVLRKALAFGVATELDMFTDHNLVAEIKRRQAAGEAPDEADLRSSGTLATAPGGHGTEYGMPIPTISAPGEARSFVDGRIDEGSDYVKIIYDDLFYPSIDRETLGALVEAAHERGKLAVVHVLTHAQASDAVEAGADGLAHLFIDRLPDPGFGRLLAEKGTFVIPTLTVLEGACGVPSGASLATDPRLAPYLSEADAQALRTAFPPGFFSDPSYGAAEEAVRLCKEAGVPILAGTDAPNPGTLHGASIHRELELLVGAGLSPLEALRSATSVPADAFGLDDRGRIASGMRADLVLVEGDPTEDVLATRAIAGVWKQGTPLDRRAYREEVAQRRAAAGERRAPTGSESGWVSDFERDLDEGVPTARFGHGWDVSTDGLRGGASTAEIRVVEGGANGSKGSLLVEGEVAEGGAFSWAGAAFFPGKEPYAPANLGAFEGISFWAKGDGKTYSLTLFAHTMEAMPASAPFTAGPEWEEHTFPFSGFNGMDGRELLTMQFIAGPAPGRFSLRIDDVRFV